MISIASLIAAGIPPTQARAFADPLLLACARFFIDTPVRQAAFVAQCAHESVMFTQLEEGLYYRSPERVCKIFPRTVPTLALAMTLVRKPQALANFVYANKNGNGSPASGDGWRFRGRGLIQLTGRENYRQAARETDRPYLDDPDLLLEPYDAALTAAWYWYSRRLNDDADASNIDQITLAINGPGMVAADERRQLFAETLHAFNSTTPPERHIA